MAAARLGLRVPTDLSLASVLNDSVPIGGVAVSGVEVRHAAMSECAVDLLLAKLESPEPSQLEPVAIAPRVVEGETIAPPANASGELVQ